jgi:dihydropteroate synthase
VAARFDVPVSIDTRKAAVAREALAAGASVVNDVSAFAHDPEMAGVAREASAGVVLMHMRGTPADMTHRAQYGDVVAEVRGELESAADRARMAGIAAEALVLDPGIGFAKTGAPSLAVLAGLPGLLDLGYPLLVGPSRKSFLGEILDVPPKERGVGTAAACVMAYLGGARMFRVHDVAACVQALAVAHAIDRERH